MGGRGGGGGEGILASFIRDTVGCFVLFIFMDLGQRVSTLTLRVGRGGGGVKGRS